VSRAGYVTQSRQVTLSAAHPGSVHTIELKRGTTKPAPVPATKAPASAQKPSAPAGKAAAPAAGAAAPATETPSPGPQVSGSLTVASRPAGATVSVDGLRAGTTPVRVSNLQPGAHKVEVVLAGYRPWSSTVTLKSGEQGRIAASLDRW
jgi:serine/threonine-protein kinase